MQSPPKPCTDCGVLVRDGSSRCDAHKARPGTFADARRGSRQSRGYGAQWEHTRARILARDKGLCQPCLRAGAVSVARDCDHIVPKGERGTDADDNLQAICTVCHRAKTADEAQRARRRTAGQTASRGRDTHHAGAPRGGPELSDLAPQDRQPPAFFARAGFGGWGVNDAGGVQASARGRSG